MNYREIAYGNGGVGISSSDDRLTELYKAHASNAVRLAALLTGDPNVAEDIAHEAFTRLGARLITLRHPDRAAGYLYRTVGNLAKGHGRRLTRDRKLKQRLTPEELAVERDTPSRGAVWDALLRLSVRHRQALFLRHYLDMPEAEAAEVMGLSTAAMKSLTHRASEACRKELVGRGDDGTA